MLLISNEDVIELLDMATCIEVQEKAFLGLVSGASITRPRIDMYVPCDRDDAYYRWGTTEGASDGILAVRLKSDIVSWPQDASGRAVEDKYCMQPGTFCGLVLLFSTRDGEPLAIMNDGAMQQRRVAAGAGIGAKYLSREDSEVVGLIGSGGMARQFLAAFKAVREIKQVKIYSRSEQRRTAFAKEMSQTLGIEVQAVDSPREAIRNADIVSTCTDSMSPVFDAEWLEPGMHVANLGPYEIPPDAFARIDIVIRQGEDGLPMAESDRFRKGIGHSFGAYIGGTAEEMKRLPAPKAQTPKTWPTFVDLATGIAPGRTSAAQITHYSAIGNFGLQFSSAGGIVYQRAVQASRGRTLPTEWFLQNIRN